MACILQCLFWLFLFIERIQGKGHVSLELIKYSNPSGRDATDSCCEGPFSCDDPCDPQFKICFRELPNMKRKCPVSTKYYKDTNSLQFGSTIPGNIKNPVVFEFDEFVTGLRIEIDALDYDGSWIRGDADHIETVTKDIAGALAFNSTTPPTRMVLSGTRISIEVVLRVKCDEHYFGQGCGVYCRAEDNPHHYVCTSTGKKTCLSRLFCETAMTTSTSFPPTTTSTTRDTTHTSTTTSSSSSPKPPTVITTSPATTIKTLTTRTTAQTAIVLFTRLALVPKQTNPFDVDLTLPLGVISGGLLACAGFSFMAYCTWRKCKKTIEPETNTKPPKAKYRTTRRRAWETN